MSTVKKPAKGSEDLQAAMQALILKGKKEGMIKDTELSAILEKMQLSPEKIEEIYDRFEAMNIQIVTTELDIDDSLDGLGDGLGDNLIKQADDALEARELIKGKVLENSMLTAREAAEELKVVTRSQVVQVIGNKFVLYRMQHDKEKRRIQLVKAPRRDL